MERSTYAFYIYLFFADYSINTLPARTAAAEATLTLFSDVSNIHALRLKDSQLAALYIPVKSSISAQHLRYTGSSDDLVTEYDYDRARLLRKEIGIWINSPLPTVALLGYRSRLFALQRPLEVSHFYIIALDHLSRETVQDRILKLRDALELGAGRLQEMEAISVRPAQNYFAQVGVVLKAYDPVHAHSGARN